MKDSTRFNLCLVLGAAVFGAALMAIESATGHLHWQAEYRAHFSPVYVAVIGFLGGAACSLRIIPYRKMSTPATVAIAIAGGAVLSAIAVTCQVYGLPQYLGNLQPLGAAAFGAVLLGGITLLGVFLAGRR